VVLRWQLFWRNYLRQTVQAELLYGAETIDMVDVNINDLGKERKRFIRYAGKCNLFTRIYYITFKLAIAMSKLIFLRGVF
jgi:hypothetical protein